MGEQIIKSVYSEKGRNWNKAIVFAEISPFEQFAVAESEIIAGSFVLGNNLFELAVLAAVVIHFIDELRIMNVMLIGVDKFFYEVELSEMIDFIAGKEKSQNDDKDNGNIRWHKNHTPNILSTIVNHILDFFSILFMLAEL